MSNIANSDIQVMEFLYDFAVHGGAIGQINLATRLANNLPVNSSILRVSYNVETALTSGGAATIAIGDVASGARYLAATAVASYTIGLLAAAAIGVPHQVATADAGRPAITVAAAALTAGKMRIFVEYMQRKS